MLAAQSRRWLSTRKHLRPSRNWQLPAALKMRDGCHDCHPKLVSFVFVKIDYVDKNSRVGRNNISAACFSHSCLSCLAGLHLPLYATQNHDDFIPVNLVVKVYFLILCLDVCTCSFVGGITKKISWLISIRLGSLVLVFDMDYFWVSHNEERGPPANQTTYTGWYLSSIYSSLFVILARSSASCSL